MSTPFVAIGPDELGAPIRKGDIIEHRHPNGEWEAAEIQYGKKVLPDGTREDSGLLAFYKLKDGISYLAGVDGQLIRRDGLRLKAHAR